MTTRKEKLKLYIHTNGAGTRFLRIKGNFWQRLLFAFEIINHFNIEPDFYWIHGDSHYKTGFLTTEEPLPSDYFKNRP